MGSIKPPLFQTSTFIFESAQAAERLFDITYGGAPLEEGEEPGFIYTRLDHPNLAIGENRLAVWDGADESLLFSSGTAAVFTTMLSLLEPDDLILHSAPLYGGTNSLFRTVLEPLGFGVASFGPDATERDLSQLIGERRLGVVYLETPANPTNDVFDIAMASRFAAANSDDARRVTTVVDNTFLGPFAQRPLEHGADLVVYSATKYLGGHSDLVAGAVSGSAELLEAIKTMRYMVGTTADPHSAWLLSRSLETYSLRVEKQTSNAGRVADFLADHPRVAKVTYLGLEGSDHPLSHQWSAPGAMITFEVVGGREGAFRFLDAMDLIGLTTSLGGTETIACHPWTTTHSNVDSEERKRLGVTEALIRLSVGVEAPEDIIADLAQALSHV
jgi:methionine-gamma-lyase